ncbi:MAG: hypothetical protein AAFZ58_00830 [Pseudomonadota bacterium]
MRPTEEYRPVMGGALLPITRRLTTIDMDCTDGNEPDPGSVEFAELVRARRVLAICDAVFVLPPADRGRFLDGVCAGDPELRMEAEALLVAVRAAGNFLETAPNRCLIDFVDE